jgi:hypothetical protein
MYGLNLKLLLVSGYSLTQVLTTRLTDWTTALNVSATVNRVIYTYLPAVPDQTGPGL